jgi:hypothetical protein
LSLRDLGGVMITFYGAGADVIMRLEGEINRFDHTAFGPRDICAHHLAEKSEGLNGSAEFAEHFPRPQIPAEPWISIPPHWKTEAGTLGFPASVEGSLIFSSQVLAQVPAGD